MTTINFRHLTCKSLWRNWFVAFQLKEVNASTYVTPQEKCGFTIKRGKYILFFILICIQAQKSQRHPRL